MIEPTTVEKDRFTVVGSHYEGTNQTGNIRELWDEVEAMESTLAPVRDGTGFYGVSFGGDPDTGEFEYVAGVKAKPGADPPPELTAIEVPAATYVCIETPLAGMEATMRRVHTEWLPASSFELAMGPEFERYPDGFDRSDPDATFDIFVPVVPEEA